MKGVLDAGTWRTFWVTDCRLGGQGHPQYHGWPCLTQKKVPWKFHVDIFSRSVSEIRGQWGGTWRTLRVSDWRLGGHHHSWCHGWSYFIPRKLLWKFCVHIFIRSVSGMGVKKGGTWRTLRVPDWRHEGYGHPWHFKCSLYMIPNISAKFQFSSIIISVSRTPLSSSVTWMTWRDPDQRHGGHGSSLTS